MDITKISKSVYSIGVFLPRLALGSCFPFVYMPFDAAGRPWLSACPGCNNKIVMKIGVRRSELVGRLGYLNWEMN